MSTATVNSVDLDKIAADYKKAYQNVKRRIIICGGTGCVANGSLDVRDALAKELEKAGIDVILEVKAEDRKKEDTYISKSGCQGFCQMGPLLHIEPGDILYTKVKIADVPEIVERTLQRGEIIDRLLYVDHKNGNCHCKGDAEIPFYNRQKRVVLANCRIEPGDVREYIARGGYFGARKAVLEMKPEEVCQTAIESGLRGRGGGGFPAGRKWDGARKQKSAKKYIVCNGDEGDPGAFMDRSVMEGNPHSVLEGMMIAARAIGADEGYVYVRAEYPLAVERMRAAVKDAEAIGVLGDNLFGSDFSFRVNVMEGAGAFVCGEETALIASIEGKRGMPKPKPPFPAQKGYWQKPSNINNVETFANVPWILENGGEAFAALGTEDSKGTKVFALTGKIKRGGLVEIPMGKTLRDVIYGIGGGIRDGKEFKAVQMGGPSGGCIPASLLDTVIDYKQLSATGAIMGSGGMVVMDETTCMVDMARFFLDFTAKESCGKCIHCRIGTKRMLEILNRIVNGEGRDGDIELLEELCTTIKDGALCGLGQTAPNPVLTTIRYFRNEYEAHIYDKKCPAGHCPSLITYQIDPEKCRGCTLCAKKCPVGAISGTVKEPHTIDDTKCIKCGKCLETCKFGAVSV